MTSEANVPGPLHSRPRPPLEPNEEEMAALSLAAHSRVKSREDAKASQLQIMEAKGCKSFQKRTNIFYIIYVLFKYTTKLYSIHIMQYDTI